MIKTVMSVQDKLVSISIMLKRSEKIVRIMRTIMLLETRFGIAEEAERL
jgi:hypothetical protein